MTKFVMKEMPDMQNTGKQVTYPAFSRLLHADFKKLVKRVHEVGGFHEGLIEGVLVQTANELATLMSEGRSVKIDGIGTFTPALVLRENKERESAEEDTVHLNARSVRVGRVNFKVDKLMLRHINDRCELERSTGKPRRSSNKYTAEERLKLALKYLAGHEFLTVQDYRMLTGLLRTAATTELNQWVKDPLSGIGGKGTGAHRVFVKKALPEE
jgi:predicted histone-like DNA-binding protein